MQTQILRAIIDRIIPADDFPSASEAGVLDFLQRIIALESLQETYDDGLVAIELEAQKSGKAFCDLSPTGQDHLLHELEKSDDPKIRRFIEVLVRQTVEGYYSDPGNGGNREGIAWDMVGFRVTV